MFRYLPVRAATVTTRTGLVSIDLLSEGTAIADVRALLDPHVAVRLALDILRAADPGELVAVTTAVVEQLDAA